MAILKCIPRPRNPMKATLLVLGATFVGGCLVIEQLGWGEGRLAFSHAKHVGEEELECLDCHMGYEDDDPGMPRERACMLCHEDIDSEAPPARRIENLFADGKFKVAAVNALDSEIKFSHLAHVTDEEGCADCHDAIIESDGVRPWMAITMEQCVSCHEAKGASTSCETCHEEIRADVPPPSHAAGWTEFHGQSVRNASHLTANRCDTCHEESTCTTCHQEQPPANHTNYWRRRAHGLTARMDRQTCSACHEPSYCDRCHSNAVPQSHNGLWGSSKNTHCLNCHTSGSQQSCSLCHLSGTPSHSLAPPKPPGHNPASNCRACHLILPHADNGDDCNSCHN